MIQKIYINGTRRPSFGFMRPTVAEIDSMNIRISLGMEPEVFDSIILESLQTLDIILDEFNFTKSSIADTCREKFGRSISFIGAMNTEHDKWLAIRTAQRSLEYCSNDFDSKSESEYKKLAFKNYVETIIDEFKNNKKSSSNKKTASKKLEFVENLIKEEFINSEMAKNISPKNNEFINSRKISIFKTLENILLFAHQKATALSSLEFSKKTPFKNGFYYTLLKVYNNCLKAIEVIKNINNYEITHLYSKSCLLIENLLEYLILLNFFEKSCKKTINSAKDSLDKLIRSEKNYIFKYIKVWDNQCAIYFTDSGQQANIASLIAMIDVQLTEADKRLDKFNNAIYVFEKSYYEVISFLKKSKVVATDKESAQIVFIDITQLSEFEFKEFCKLKSLIIDITQYPNLNNKILIDLIEFAHKKNIWITLTSSFIKHEQLSLDKYQAGKIIVLSPPNKNLPLYVAHQLSSISKHAMHNVTAEFLQMINEILIEKTINTSFSNLSSDIKLINFEMAESKLDTDELDGDSLFSIGYFYHQMNFYLKNMQDEDLIFKALTLFAKAATKNHSLAQLYIANYYYHGHGLETDYNKVLKWLVSAAQSGNAEAQIGLAAGYYNGKFGLIKDSRKAHKWLIKAAESKHPDALFNLGKKYYFGNEIEEDKIKARQLISSAANLDHEAAQCFMGFLENDSKLSLNHFENSARQGFVLAKVQLGHYYYCGRGIERNLKKAFSLYYEAAEQDLASATFALGGCYYYGNGQTKNLEIAYYYFFRAANQLYVDSLLSLGWCYYFGKGVAQNFLYAFKAFKCVADQTQSALAYTYLGWCYLNGEGVEQNYCEAFEFFRKAALKGFPDAQFLLGCLFIKGYGQETNLHIALDWIAKAAQQRHPQAISVLAWCYTWGYGVKKDSEIAEKFCKLTIEDNEVELGDTIHPSSDLMMNYMREQSENKTNPIMRLSRGSIKSLKVGHGRKLSKYKQAAEQKNMLAQFELSKHLPQHTSKDYLESVKWCKLAADQGYHKAQYKLGCYYEDGFKPDDEDDELIKPNEAAALHYFKLSAKQGNINAMHKIIYDYAEYEIDQEASVEDYQKRIKEKGFYEDKSHFNELSNLLDWRSYMVLPKPPHYMFKIQKLSQDPTNRKNIVSELTEFYKIIGKNHLPTGNFDKFLKDFSNRVSSSALNSEDHKEEIKKNNTSFQFFSKREKKINIDSVKIPVPKRDDSENLDAQNPFFKTNKRAKTHQSDRSLPTKVKSFSASTNLEF